MSIALCIVFHSLQLSEFNKGFNGSMGTILGDNLGDELHNRNVFELLPLLVVALVPLLRSQDRSEIALSDQRTSALDFDGRRELFMPSTLSSILLSITSSKLSF